MKYKDGIICLETEWEHTVKSNQISLHTKPLLEFLENAWHCKTIYRRVATRSELQYYLNRFNNPEYDDLSIIYLSFHGDTHSIILEGENKDNCDISLEELSKMSNGVFRDRFVHFSSCRTLIGSNKELEKFKNDTGALYISGYSTSVDSIQSAINDIAYFDQIFRHQKKRALIRTAMEKYYQGLDNKLGFKII